MSYTPGVNCHFTLSHPLVDSGAAFGFLVNVDDKTKKEGIKVVRVIDTEGNTQLWVYFDVLLADRLLNPDGSFHADSKATMYSKLMQFMAYRDDLTLTTAELSYLNLGAIGFTADERHFPTHSIVKCQLNNIGVYWPAVDPLILQASVWDGELTWESSYWR